MTGNSKQSVCQEHQPGAETWIHSALELILQKLEEPRASKFSSLINLASKVTIPLYHIHQRTKQTWVAQRIRQAAANIDRQISRHSARTLQALVSQFCGSESKSSNCIFCQLAINFSDLANLIQPSIKDKAMRNADLEALIAHQLEVQTLQTQMKNEVESTLTEEWANSLMELFEHVIAFHCKYIDSDDSMLQTSIVEQYCKKYQNKAFQDQLQMAQQAWVHSQNLISAQSQRHAAELQSVLSDCGAADGCSDKLDQLKLRHEADRLATQGSVRSTSNTLLRKKLEQESMSLMHDLLSVSTDHSHEAKRQSLIQQHLLEMQSMRSELLGKAEQDRKQYVKEQQLVVEAWRAKLISEQQIQLKVLESQCQQCLDSLHAEFEAQRAADEKSHEKIVQEWDKKLRDTRQRMSFAQEISVAAMQFADRRNAEAHDTFVMLAQQIERDWKARALNTESKLQVCNAELLRLKLSSSTPKHVNVVDNADKENCRIQANVH